MDSPLRLIASNPLDQLARTLEALLVVASAPLSVAELAEAADDDAERVEAALGLVRERYSLDVCLPQMEAFFAEVGGSTARQPPSPRGASDEG